MNDTSTPNDQAGTTGEKKGKGFDAVLKECRERLQMCIQFEGDNRSNALDDLRFLSGDQWPEEIKRARDLDGRPCLTINTLPTFLHQVTNDQRMNKGSIKVHPVDDNADIETAEVIQGLIRHIEYDSNADVAYDRAVNSAAAIGFGYFRLVTEYENETSFNQNIMFESIRNPMTVYFDPASEEPDGSDARFVIISVKMPRDEFRTAYPNADMAGFDEVVGTGDFHEWCDDQMVRVAEYYRITETQEEIVLLSNGESGFKSDLLEMPPGVTIIKTRKGPRSKVEWSKITAIDELESAVIPCRWIPVFPVYGDELDIEGKIIRSGLVRPAKDPARQYNFFMTCATEEVALRPKSPFIGAEGQFEGNEDTWSQANSRSFAYLEYKPVTIDGTLAPPPQRQPPADVPNGMLAMALHASENIKKTTGIYDASLGAKSNETSGKAIVARQREGDVGNFHFTDNLNRSRRHAGRCIINMLPKVYDTERAVRILGDDDSATYTTINKPNLTGEKNEAGEVRDVLNDLTAGTYDVTVTSGPSYTTMRQEAADSMIQFGQSWPKLMDVAGDKVVKAMDWPGAEEIAERISRTIPPEIKGDDDEEGEVIQTPKGPLPVAQAGQAIAGMEMHIQQLEQAIQGMGEEKQAIEAEKSQLDAAKKSLDAQNRVMSADFSRMKTELENIAIKQDAATQKVVSDLMAKFKEIEDAMHTAVCQMAKPQESAEHEQQEATSSAAMVQALVQMHGEMKQSLDAAISALTERA